MLNAAERKKKILTLICYIYLTTCTLFITIETGCSIGFSLLLADGLFIEQDAERKIGRLLKLLLVGTTSVVAYQIFPYMGL